MKNLNNQRSQSYSNHNQILNCLMFKNFLLVFLGGGAGSMLRFGVSLIFPRSNSFSFPLSTFLVNIIGCFLLGLIVGLVEKYDHLSVPLQILLVTGFCGGFTTFSAFAYENVKMLQEGHAIMFVIYTISSLAAGLLFLLAGLNLVKLF